MMDVTTQQKVRAVHVNRHAYLYVRQSTLRQVVENSESTRRQYDLKQRAIALGWAPGQVVVIDSDLGLSGASAVNRDGFQQLVAEVGMGRAGIVMGLEVSRLARNSTDWHRLLEICALTETLILDEDGVYDPMQFNDRLLLGLKGTMSEAELHVIRARMRGGLLSKARRGELVIPLPMGFAYGPEARVVLDPDARVQESIRALFATFRRTGAATATARAFDEQGLLYPRRLRGGPQTGELVWLPLTTSLVIRTLHNPRYAGAFVFGRTRQRKRVDGRAVAVKLEREDWAVLLRDTHDGYITWADYEENLRILRENAQARGADRRPPPREGPALLQGLALCGVCGRRMTIRYRHRGEQLHPQYLCQTEAIESGYARLRCQCVVGTAIDEAMGHLLLEIMTPAALEVALAVQQEIQTRLEEADRLRSKRVEAAQYAVNLARRRYMQVDPENRLVADELEADWNEKLRAMREARDECERKRQTDRELLGAQQRDAVLALASDFPRLWASPQTSARDRKRLVRLLIEDVTIIKQAQITLHVRFRGGTTRTLTLPIGLPAPLRYQTKPELVREIDRLLDEHTDQEIIDLLNARELRSGEGRPLNRYILTHIRRNYGLRSHHERLREKGLLTTAELCQRLGVSPSTITRWRRAGRVRGHACNSGGGLLYEMPGPDVRRYRRPSRMESQAMDKVCVPQPQEVQCET